MILTTTSRSKTTIRRLTEIASNKTPMLKCGHAANGTCSNKGGIHYDPPVPCCVICSCIEVTNVTFSLEGRKAKRCTEASIRDSSTNLAFFEYRGAGSKAATQSCKGCGYHKIAHKPDRMNRSKRVCTNFQPHGAWEFDLYYCGCRGWD